MSLDKNSKNGDFFIKIVLFLIPSIFLWKIIFDSQHYTIATFQDNLFNIYATYHFYLDSLSKFSLPLWDFYRHAGIPFLYDPLFSGLYPMNYVCLPVYMITKNVYTFLIFSTYLHYCIAIFSMYYFLKHNKSSKFTCLIGAILFAFGGGLSLRMNGQIQIFWSFCWLPLILLCYQKSLEANKKPNIYTYLTSIIFSVVILSGQHYTFILDGLTIFLFTVFAYVKDFNKGFLEWSVVNLLLIVIITGLLSAVFILPSYELASRSFRWIGSPNDPVMALGKISYADASKYSGTLENILSFFERTWESQYINLYIGVLSLFFLGIAFAKKNRDRAFYWFTFIFFSLASLGNKTFIYYALYMVVPMFDKIRTVYVLLYPAIFCLICLVCYGIDEFANAKVKVKSIRSGPGDVFRNAAAVIIVILFIGLLAGNARLFEISISASGFIFLLSIGAILIWKIIKPAYDVRIVILLFILIDLLAFINVNLPRISDKNNPNWFKDDEMIYKIIKSDAGKGGFRVFAPNDILPRNFGEVYKISNFEGYGALMLQDFYRERGFPHEGDDNKLFNLMSVKYHISDKAINNMQGYKLLKRINKKYIYENTLYFPKAFLIESVNYILDISSSVDVKKKIMLVNNYVIKPNAIEMGFSVSKPASLVISENYYPGWRASDNGKNVQINKYRNIMFIDVSKGQHDVKIIFRPFKFYLGAGISVIMLLTVCFLIFQEVFGATFET